MLDILRRRVLHIYMRLVQIVDYIKTNGFSALLREVVYFNREAVVLEKDLHNLILPKTILQDNDIKLIDITPNTFADIKFEYKIKNRYLKLLDYLKNGYGVIALVRNNMVIGDIWYFASDSHKHNADHPDIYWLGIKSAEKYIYAYDMYVNPDERGTNLAASLQGGALSLFQQKGYKKAFGFYWSDNIPALWVNRMLKWKEINRIKINRFLFYKRQSNG